MPEEEKLEELRHDSRLLEASCFRFGTRCVTRSRRPVGPSARRPVGPSVRRPVGPSPVGPCSAEAPRRHSTPCLALSRTPSTRPEDLTEGMFGLRALDAVQGDNFRDHELAVVSPVAEPMPSAAAPGASRGLHRASCEVGCQAR